MPIKSIQDLCDAILYSVNLGPETKAVLDECREFVQQNNITYDEVYEEISWIQEVDDPEGFLSEEDYQCFFDEAGYVDIDSACMAARDRVFERLDYVFPVE
uniref:Uncharacterized protein n=1 Tax=viral metagenome TaxID=1070528 RepID=A0A6C0CJC5_9ZZZZ